MMIAQDKHMSEKTSLPVDFAFLRTSNVDLYLSLFKGIIFPSQTLWFENHDSTKGHKLKFDKKNKNQSD